MEILREDGKIKVQSGYDRRFVKKAHELNGKWEKPFWNFDEKHEEILNEILISIYGEGLEPVETTEIEIDLDAYEKPWRSSGPSRSGPTSRSRS